MQNLTAETNPQPQPAQPRPPYQWSLLWAVHTAGAIVARADGRICAAERLALHKYLRRSPLACLKSPLLRGLFEKCLREVERAPANERSTLANALAGFDGTPWAWIILRAAEHVAAADAAVHPAEARTLAAIRTALNLPPGVPERYVACVLTPAHP